MARKVKPRTRRVAIKVANYAPSQTLVVAFSRWDATRMLSVQQVDVLSASTPSAENTLDSPEAVSPRKLTPAPTWDDARHLRMVLPGWSVVVLTIAVS
jgi:alpha-L-arabinofuranosidase